MREPVRDKERLEHIIASIDNIFDFVKGKKPEDLDVDKMMFYAVVKNIEVIGEAAFRLTKSFCQLHPDTPWPSIVGMRHVLVHDYYQIKSKEVWKVINEDLLPLLNQISSYISETDWQAWEKQEIVPAESDAHRSLVQAARRMLSKGMNPEEISDITGLSIDEISVL